MAKKAVYNNQYLGIYITKEDLDDMIEKKSAAVPFFIGQDKTELGHIIIQVLPGVRGALKYALECEREAVSELQEKFRRDHPDYENSEQRRKRLRHARR